MSDLEIPDAALSTYEEAGSYRHALKIAAPLIVAAELRRLAKEGRGRGWQTAERVLIALRRRADELDPQ